MTKFCGAWNWSILKQDHAFDDSYQLACYQRAFLYSNCQRECFFLHPHLQITFNRAYLKGWTHPSSALDRVTKPLWLWELRTDFGVQGKNLPDPTVLSRGIGQYLTTWHSEPFPETPDLRTLGISKLFHTNGFSGCWCLSAYWNNYCIHIFSKLFVIL